MNSFEEPQRVPIRHRIRKHMRIRMERRPHVGKDWLGVVIILGAAFLVGNFILRENNLFIEASAIQDIISQEQFEVIRGAIQRFE